MSQPILCGGCDLTWPTYEAYYNHNCNVHKVPVYPNVVNATVNPIHIDLVKDLTKQEFIALELLKVTLKTMTNPRDITEYDIQLAYTQACRILKLWSE